MITSDEFNQFCKAHLQEAMNYAEMNIGSIINEKGQINRKFDVENVKHLAVFSALEKAYVKFDPKRAKNQKLSPFLSKLVANEIRTELRKESTAVDRFEGFKRRKPADAGENPGLVIPRVKLSGVSERIFEPHEYMDIFGSIKGKELQKNKMRKAFRQLSPIDQTILHYWMYQEVDDRSYMEVGEKPTRTYIQRAIDDLGLDESWTNAITIRRFKAIKKLRKLLQGVAADYENMYVPGSSNWKDFDDDEKTCVRIYSDEEYSKIGEDLYRTITED